MQRSRVINRPIGMQAEAQSTDLIVGPCCGRLSLGGASPWLGVAWAEKSCTYPPGPKGGRVWGLPAFLSHLGGLALGCLKTPEALVWVLGQCPEWDVRVSCAAISPMASPTLCSVPSVLVTL